MTALICGSLAYDTIMVFNGRFREHILPDPLDHSVAPKIASAVAAVAD